MASIEDCLKVVPNRFELVILASYRTKTLMNGSTPLCEVDNHEKSTVTSLNEIGESLININEFKNLAENSLRSQFITKIADDNDLYVSNQNTTEKDNIEVDLESDNFIDDDLSPIEDEDSTDDDSYYEKLGDIKIDDDIE
jgi:DNA-directed RNA polymerase subunit omega